MTTAAPSEAPERVLSTLNRDGTRRWLDPRLSKGRFLARRRVVAYVLLVLYNALPWIEINGKPAMLLDVARREFTFFGTTFLSTDTLLLMLFIAGVFVLVFLLTALFGRVWCGWGCPQTVYMEFVFRPLERLCLGASPAARRQNAGAMPLRRALMYLAYFVVAFHLANTFLSYFVGARTVFQWSLGSPLNHPAAFLLVLAVTGLILFDFAYFREQVCIVACPYGRLQSVMLDRSSLIISYDEKRGEPRGKKGSKDRGNKGTRHQGIEGSRGQGSEPGAGDSHLSSRSALHASMPLALMPAPTGDCIDCRLCVTTCPTGIDIRDGLQMECIGCAQCIDACDAVMEKIGRPRGLIRYSSREAMEAGRKHPLRPRVILYPGLLLVIASLFVLVLVNRAPADITLLRASTRPYVTLTDGRVVNEVTVKIVNRTDELRRYDFSIEDMAGGAMETITPVIEVAPGETGQVVLSITSPRGVFQRGMATATIIIRDDAGYEKRMPHRLQGPFGGGTRGGSAVSESDE